MNSSQQKIFYKKLYEFVFMTITRAAAAQRVHLTRKRKTSNVYGMTEKKKQIS